ncbi:MAG: hypothetical protein AAFV53_08675 [Myxococcota bacterium]
MDPMTPDALLQIYETVFGPMTSPDIAWREEALDWVQRIVSAADRREAAEHMATWAADGDRDQAVVLAVQLRRAAGIAPAGETIEDALDTGDADDALRRFRDLPDEQQGAMLIQWHQRSLLFEDLAAIVRKRRGLKQRARKTRKTEPLLKTLPRLLEEYNRLLEAIDGIQQAEESSPPSEEPW